MISQNRLKDLLDYDEHTGVFIWKKRTGGRIVRGSIAGSAHNKGYVKIYIDGRGYLAHRLAWLYVNASMPKTCIDHIDGDPSNNRISNLREATVADNLANRGAQKNNTSGHKGVWFDDKTRKWVADIYRHGRKIHLGRHETKEGAANAYKAAAENLVGEFAHHNRSSEEARVIGIVYQKRWRAKLTVEEKNDIKMCVADGMSHEDVARKFGIKCVSTVYRVIRNDRGAVSSANDARSA